MKRLSLLASSIVLAACAAPPRVTARDGIVVAQDEFKGALVGVSAKSGKPTYRLPTDGWADAPPISNGKVFVHGEWGVAARDASTGAIAWRTLVQSPYQTSVALGAGSVFVPTLQGRRHVWVGLSEAKGEPTFDVPSDRWAPLVGAGDLVFTLRKHRLIGAGAPDGKPRWTSKEEAHAPLASGGGRVLARVGDSEIAIFEGANGDVVRRIELGSSDAMKVVKSRAMGLDFDGKRVAFLDDGGVALADVSSAKRRWTSPDVGARSAHLLGDLVVADVGDAVQAFDAEGGKSRWSTSVAPASVESIAVDAGAIVVRTDDGRLVLLDAAGKKTFTVDLAASQTSQN